MPDVYTPPVDRTTGHIVTAAEWNEQIGADGSLAFLGTTHDHSGDAGDGGTLAGLFAVQSVQADDTTTNVAYEDFAGLTLSVVVAATSDVLVLLTVGILTGSGGGTACYAIINWEGANDATTEAEGIGGAYAMPLATSLLKTGLAAATYTAKVQIKSPTSGGGETATFTNATLTAIVMPT